MSVATQQVPRLRLAPHSSGVSLTPAEFDAAEFEEGWRYELIHGEICVRLVRQALRTTLRSAGSAWADKMPTACPWDTYARCYTRTLRD